MGESPLSPSIEEVIPDGSNRWAISPQLARFLARAITGRDLRSVLEFGAGGSSLVLARALSSIGGGTLTSVEQWPEWCKEPWARVEQTPNVDARLVAAQPRLALSRVGLTYAFRSARAAIASRRPYDLVVVDAPPRFYGRDGALPLSYAHLVPGAWVVLDDARRAAEQWTLFRWLRTYPGLRLMHFDAAFGGRGLAVLRYTGERTQRVDPWSVLTSALHTYRHWQGLRGGGRGPCRGGPAPAGGAGPPLWLRGGPGHSGA